MSDASPAAAANTPNPDRYSGPGGALEYLEARSTPSPALLEPEAQGVLTTLRALTPIVADIAAPTIVLGALVVPSSNPILDQGPVPDRPDLSYRWAHDETTVTYHILIDGEWRMLVEGRQDAQGVFHDSQDRPIAVEVSSAGSKPTLVTDLAALDRTAAAKRGARSSADNSAPSTLDQVFVDPQTGRTIVAPVGTDPATLPPGFAPAGPDLNSGSSREDQRTTTLQSEDASKPPLRTQYEDAVKALGNLAAQMAANGSSLEDIARALYGARRDLGSTFKDLTPPEVLDKIYARNLQRYGDKLGPSIEWLRAQGKTWEQIIESASRPGGKDLGF